MKKMKLLLIVLPLIMLSGCMDYRGLDHLSIVAGITLDLNDDEYNMYRMGFEIVDTNADKNERGKKTVYLESVGPTIFEAIANCNAQLSKNMYFGNAELLIIQEKAAREVGLADIIEPFIRDYSVRDTLLVVVSREETAGDILRHSSKLSKVVSYDIAGALNWQHAGANSLLSLEIYQVYEDRKRDTGSVSLPAFSCTKEEIPQPELNGQALFQGDYLVDFLPDDLVPYFLYLKESMDRGTYSFFLDGDPSQRVTLIISSSKPSLSFEEQHDGMLYKADVQIVASISSLSPKTPPLDAALLKKIEEQASADLSKRLTETVQLLQNTTATDIFGFGKEVYLTDTKLWNRIRENKAEVFQTADLDLKVNIEIEKTGFLLKY